MGGGDFSGGGGGTFPEGTFPGGGAIPRTVIIIIMSFERG